MNFKISFIVVLIIILISCKNKSENKEIKKDSNPWNKTVTLEEANRIIDSVNKLPRDTSDHTRGMEDADRNSPEYKKVVKLVKKLKRVEEEDISIISYDSATKQYYIGIDSKGLCKLWYYSLSTNKLVNECDLENK
ncbi:MAG: hypothetical protein WCP65_00790 [Bacteroidota bacterium]